jgi:chemotaxis protein methyltransferase CheR
LFHSLIYNSSGMFIKETRLKYLETRIQKRLEVRRIPSVYSYYKFLTNGEDGAEELKQLLDLLTVNETYFFRNPPQIKLFEERLLPEMISKRESERNKALRIWSAGCSTGEEPYSIAISILDRLSYPRLWDVKVYASDISLSVLKKAKEGIYSKERLREASEKRIDKYFSLRKGGYAIRDEVKKYVIFDFHNLKFENGLRDLDAIFCRNVMIYFDAEEQRRLIQKFHAALRPGGYLLVGHAETLQGLSSDFRFVHENRGSAYQKI